MSGPIVRTGTTPKFWQNWDQAFGKKKSGQSMATARGAKTAAPKSAKKSKKSSAKSAVAKKTKKGSGKK